MVLQHPLDLVRRDAVAEALEGVVLAAEEPEVAVGVAARVVAGQEPVAVEAGGRLLGLVPVAEHEARVGARDAEHPLLVRPDLGPRPRVEEPDVVPGLREAGRPWPEGAVPGLAEVVGALGHAEALVDVEAEALAPSLENRLREMLARAHAVPQRGHVGARGARL